MEDKKSVYTVPPDMRKKFMLFGLRPPEMIIFGVAFLIAVALLFNLGFGSAVVDILIPAAVFVVFHRPNDNYPERNIFNLAVKIVKYNISLQFFSQIPKGQIPKNIKKMRCKDEQSHKRKTNI